MDQAIKTYVSIIFIFIFSLFLITIMTFGISVNKARDSLYTIVDFLETIGYNKTIIDQYAKDNHIEVNVVVCEENDSFFVENKVKYKVDVGFSHLFSWVNFKPKVTISAYTRAVEY